MRPCRTYSRHTRTVDARKEISMNFKEIMQSDVQEVFMNVDEFCDMHMVNGKEMAVQIDSNEQIEREKRLNQHMDGVYKNQKLIYVAASDFGSLPAQGVTITIDGKRYKIVDAISESGIYSITIEANRGMGR